MSRYYQFLLCGLILCLSACSNREELASDLTSKQSVEILVALDRAAIKATREKESGGRGERYSISVEPSQFAAALELILELGLPSEPDKSFEELTRQRGFAPNSPALSRLRLDYALAAELERMLRELPGVIEARVLVRSPSSELFGDSKTKPSASVLIRYTASSNNLPFDEGQVRQLVKQSVPGLDESEIKISSSKVSVKGIAPRFGVEQGSDPENGQDVVPLTQMKPLFGFRLAEADVGRATLQLGLYLVAFGFSGWVLGMIWGSTLARKRFVRLAAEEKNNFFIEARYAGGGKEKRLTGRGDIRKPKQEE
jgi:type III secretion system YscJ/HrcJ family lipoprotein